jgi:hypothetical protein
MQRRWLFKIPEGATIDMDGFAGIPPRTGDAVEELQAAARTARARIKAPANVGGTHWEVITRDDSRAVAFALAAAELNRTFPADKR